MMTSPKVPDNGKMGNVVPEKLDTNQQTRPLPYWWGRKWFAVTWCVSKVYNYKATKKSSGGGKGGKGGGSQTVATVDVAGLVACCQADFLEAIEVNGEIVWSAGGGISRDGSHVNATGAIVVPDVGTFNLVWGTETQTDADFIVLNSSAPEVHPFYRGQVVLEAKNLNCGSSGSPPNIRVLLERAPVFSGLDGSRSREGANPITGIAELIEDDFFGCAMTDVIDMLTAPTVADAIKARTKTVAITGDPAHVANMGYLSAFLTDRQSLSSFIAGVLETFDGWIRRNGEKLELGYFTHGDIDTSGLLELTLHDFVDDPQFPNPAPDDPMVITDAIVTGPDRAWNMEDSWQMAGNDAVRDRIKETRQKTYARPFLCTSYQQKEQAQELANFYSVPAKESTHKFRREKVGALKPGDRFIVNYSPSSLRQVYRVTQRSDPATGGEVELGVIIERGLAPLTYIAAADPSPTLPQPPIAQTIVHARMVQLKPMFTGKQDPVVVPLAERPAGSDSGFRVHFSSDGGLSYNPLAETLDFALRGSIVANIAAGATTFTIATAGLGLDLDIALLQEQSDADRLDDTLLLFVGSEIMSIGAVTALGGGQYSVTVLRGRCGTSAVSHNAADELYVLPRAELLQLSHAAFPWEPGTINFKLQALAVGDDEDLSTALMIAFAFTSSHLTAPLGLTLLTDSTTNILQPNGAYVPRLKVTWTMPTDPLLLAKGKARVEYKAHSAATWIVWSEFRADRNVEYITDVQIGAYYDVRVQFEGLDEVRSADTSGNETWAEVDNYLVLGDTTAPARLGSPSVIGRPGYNEISWAVSTEVDTVEYGVYRNTSNTTAGATKLGETAGTDWDDGSATPGVTYWYFITAIDSFENESTPSLGTSVTTALAPVGAAVPGAPTAASRVTPGTDDTYLSGDGTVYSFITLLVPALVANAVWQTTLYRRAGASDWLVAAQLKNTSSTNVRIDDLSPGVSYEFATQAWSGAGGSAVTVATGSPFTAPSRLAPPDPTGLNIYGGASFPANTIYFQNVPPMFTIGGVRRYAVRWRFNTPGTFDGMNGAYMMPLDFDHWDIKFTATDSAGATDYNADIGGGSPGIFSIPSPPAYIASEVIVCVDSPVTTYARIRAVNSSGVASNWVKMSGGGSAFMSAVSWQKPGGDLMEQASNALASSGIQIGASGASSIQKVVARVPFDIVPTLAGGSTEETVNVSLTNRGFTTKPDGTTGMINVSSDTGMKVRYDWDDVGNSSTNAVLKISRYDGATLGAGAVRLQGEFFENF